MLQGKAWEQVELVSLEDLSEPMEMAAVVAKADGEASAERTAVRGDMGPVAVMDTMDREPYPVDPQQP